MRPRRKLLPFRFRCDDQQRLLSIAQQVEEAAIRRPRVDFSAIGEKGD